VQTRFIKTVSFIFAILAALPLAPKAFYDYARSLSTAITLSAPGWMTI